MQVAQRRSVSVHCMRANFSHFSLLTETTLMSLLTPCQLFQSDFAGPLNVHLHSHRPFTHIHSIYSYSMRSHHSLTMRSGKCPDCSLHSPISYPRTLGYLLARRACMCVQMRGHKGHYTRACHGQFSLLQFPILAASAGFWASNVRDLRNFLRRSKSAVGMDGHGWAPLQDFATRVKNKSLTWKSHFAHWCACVNGPIHLVVIFASLPKWAHQHRKL